MPECAVRIVLAAGLTIIGVALAGCTAGVAPSESRPTSQSPSPAPDETAPRDPSPAGEPSPSAGTAANPHQTEYEAAIADWSEPLPPGYSWPGWSDLPHIDPLRIGQLGEADNAAGVYRCILIDAAWQAYFADNDPVASKDYATRADGYVIADNPSILAVTEDGKIIDDALAVANGICRGIAGDLSH